MIMGHDHETCPQFPVELEHQAQHVLTVTGIEISGRLVGKNQLWASDQRARNRGSLSFPAGKLAGFVCQAFTEPHAPE
jgi:hypothetical protein